jgi:thymidylate synthase (FAD)
LAVRLEYKGKTYRNVVEMGRDMPLLSSTMIGWYDGAEVLIANAAANCYDTPIQTSTLPSEDGTYDIGKLGSKIVKHCRDSHHNTVIEHGSATFFKKVPIFVARQDLRARHASFDERSLRYCRATDGSLQYFVPHYLKLEYIDKVLKEHGTEKASFLQTQRQEWINEHEQAIQRYSKYTDDEIYAIWGSLGLDTERVRETQRSRLPLGIATTYVDTRNLWSWIHHSEKRLCLRAQDEIRLVRRQEVNQLKKVFPTIFGDVNMPCYMAGGCPEVKTCGKIDLDPTGKWAVQYLNKQGR